ncbi:hypothetical protein C8R46DRAFT_901036 [Mycena filopes]|nr:hypothetical protein C8R46DRAFT_901036 [Mycena filopes]
MRLPGFEILCQHRERHICIQPSTLAFARNFELISDGLLQNLDWTNVFVAGGIVLAALMVPDTPAHNHRPAPWLSSDIDIYLYGLSPAEANEKIIHVFDVFRSNLPPDMRTLVVRNSKTITFYAEYPLRRIQIVLKLLDHPKDALLNFDLDICAMGWDGTDLWMLPRAARALEIGCNTFTMHLIHGHYLAERRATQPPRLFKYADRGYGMRILPSYIAALGENSLSILEEEARIWVRDKLRPEGRPDGFWPPELVAIVIMEQRSLSGFTSLMRHTIIREVEDWGGQIVLWYESIPSLQYALSIPPRKCSLRAHRYHWNEDFNHARFRTHIMLSNAGDIDRWINTDVEERLLRYGIKNGDDLNQAQRLTFASTAKEVLEDKNDVRMPILLPVNFAVYANELVAEVLAHAGLRDEKLLKSLSKDMAPQKESTTEEEGLFIWTIGSQLMWQRLDRRIDEVFEVLYAFRRANFPLRQDSQYHGFVEELSKRRNRQALSEFDAFEAWVRR